MSSPESSLPEAWVQRIFATMRATYGAALDRQWECPAGADPVAFDREHVIVLSDWSFLHPHQIIQKLRQQAGYFNRQRMALAGRLSGEPEQQMPSADRTYNSPSSELSEQTNQ